jgi:hypothetical protein
MEIGHIRVVCAIKVLLGVGGLETT